MDKTTPKQTIIGALMLVSGSGQGVDEMLFAIAKTQAAQILSDLNDNGFVIVPKEDTYR